MTHTHPALWNKSFVFACLGYLLMAFPFYMLLPTMPVYLTEVLGMNTAWVGVALSSYTLGVFCVRPFSGYLVDCFDRKPLYITAFAVFAALFAGYLAAATVLTVMLVRFLQGMAMGITSVSGNTIAIDVIPSERRGEGIGFYGFTLNLAMLLAPLVAVVLYNRYGFRPMTVVCILIAFAGVLSATRIRTPRKEKRTRPPFSLDRFILVRAIPTGIVYLLCSVSYGMIVSFAVLYGKETGVENPGYFFIYLAVGVSVVRLFSGRLADKGKVHPLAVGSIIALAVSLVIFASMRTPFVFFGMAFVLGMCFGTMVPAFQYLVVNVAPPDRRGTANSTYLTSFDLGSGAGMLIAGFVAAHTSIGTAYLAGAGCAVLAAFIYVRFARPAYEKHRTDR
ncbi:MAG: MFS transporter [Parabacteroides sp.]|nr:MFS transporter [Parabacteroides sp.]